MLNLKSGSGIRIRFALLLSLTLGLPACEWMQFDSQKQIDKKADETLQKNASKVNEAAGVGLKSTQSDPLAVSDDVWLGNQAVHLHAGKPLPSRFENAKGFTLVSAAPVDLRTAASEITNVTGIKTEIGDLTLSADKSATTPAPSASASSTENTNADQAPPLPKLVEANINSIDVSYSGPLSKFLDQLAEQMDVSWKYDGDTISFYRYETKTFVIEAMASKSSIQDQFSPSSSGSGSSGGSSGGSSSSQDVTQKNSLSSDMDAWKDLEGALKGILASEGSEVMVPSSGTVIVTARPAKLEEVSKYIRDENRRMTRQVAIDVVAYDVSSSTDDNYGLDLSSAFSFRSHSGLGVPASTATTQTQVGSTTASITSPTDVLTTNGALTDGAVSIAYLSSHWDGNAIAKALSTLGKTTEITRAPIVTLNNRAASRKIATDQTYIASTSVTPATATSGEVVTVTPGTAADGITLQVLPRLTNDDRILLQYSIIISTVTSIGQACGTGQAGTSSAGNCIGTPNTTDKVFVQQALLQNGSTLVLAGFEHSLGNDQSEGVGSPLNWLMGGVDASNSREQLVITITPHEITPDRGNI